MVFVDQEVCLLFLTVLQEQRQRYHVLLHEYVIMPNHYHTIITPPQGYTISDTIRHINGVFATRFNKITDHSGKVFQQNFWDHVIRNDKDYNVKAAYIHDNPVRAGLVLRPEDYRWSSARERLTGERGYIGLDPIP